MVPKLLLKDDYNLIEGWPVLNKKRLEFNGGVARIILELYQEFNQEWLQFNVEVASFFLEL